MLFTRLYTLAPKYGGRLSEPQLLGFDPFESPWRPDACLGRRPLVAPLGFPLPRRLDRNLDQDFARSPLTRFFDSALNRVAGASEYQSASVPSHPPAQRGRSGLDEKPS
jgi:hypothetical protein